MIRLVIKQGLFGEKQRIERVYPWSAGITVGEIRKAVSDVVVANVHIAVDGKEVGDDHELQDGCTMVLAGLPAEEILVAILWVIVEAIIVAGISYAVMALTPKPKAPGQGQDRGEQESPTYAWDGMVTSYGQGLPIPVILGTFAAAGQGIWTDARYQQISIVGGVVTNGELLRILVALSEGPIARIGGISGEADDLGAIAVAAPVLRPLPSEVRVNDNLLDANAAVPGARMWVRNGALRQTPLPPPFTGSATLLSIGQPINGPGDEVQFTYTGTEPIESLGWMITAPSGVYEQTGSGVAGFYTRINISWRQQGATAWVTLFAVITGAQQPFVGQTTFQGLTWLGGPVAGPIEFKFTRVSPAGNASTVVSALIVRSVTLLYEQTFAYPGVALAGFELLATGRFSGALPTFKVECDGILVRVWDPTIGFSDPTFDVLAAPFDFSLSAPGRNPAWVLGEFATNTRWGMGNDLTDADVDWLALRRWSIQCDQTPGGGWDEVAHEVAMMIDSQRPAWEVVLAICSAGRASPVMVGGKLSVVYQFRDEHSDNGMTVPAKAPVQLITSGMVEEVSVRWLNRSERPTAYQFQFLDRDQAYNQDVVSVEDNEVALGDPSDPNAENWRPEVVQSYSVTRRSQHQREGVFMHRVARLIERELTFLAGPGTLAIGIGDLFDFEHEMLRPWQADRPKAMQVLQGGDGVDNVTVDHAVTGTGLAIAMRDLTGQPILVDITSLTATTYLGRPATVLELAASISVEVGAACVVGLAGKLTESYQTVAITLEQKVKRRVRALQWVPEVFDDVPAELFSSDSGVDAGGDGTEFLLAQPLVDQVVPRVESIGIAAVARGVQRLTWSRPSARASARARVFVSASDRWSLLGETADSHIDVAGALAPFQTCRIAVVLEDGRGDYEAPAAATQADLVPEEFPAWSPPPPSNLTASQSAGENLLVLRWDQAGFDDFETYEVRCGSHWAAARTVYVGKLSEARLRPPPGFTTYQVAAKNRAGMFGPRAQIAITLLAVPSLGAIAINSTEYAPTGSGGTHSNTALDSTTEPAAPFIALQAGQLSGTFTSGTVDLGYRAPFFLRVAIDVQELDGGTVDDWTFAVASGEARWRTVDGRPASIDRPGTDWSTLVDDLTMSIDDVDPNLRTTGNLGEPGSLTLCRVDSRTYDGTSWSSWATHVDRNVTCSKWEARLVMARSTTSQSVRARTFRMETLL